MAFDAGTLLFPVSYIFGDILTEVYGYKQSTASHLDRFFLPRVELHWYFGSLRILPGEATWQQYAGQDAYNAILGGMSSGGIVLASLFGYWTGEFSNSFVLAKMKILSPMVAGYGPARLAARWLGELVDSTVFILVASLFSVFPWSLFITLVLTNYLFKCSIEALNDPDHLSGG